MMLPTRRRPTAVLRNFPETRWDMDRLFDEFFVRPMASMNPTGPAADFFETDEEFVLEMNLPGFTENDIDVNLEQGVLSITGEHSEEDEEEKGTYHLRERSWTDASTVLPSLGLVLDFHLSWKWRRLEEPSGQ